jgi:hypothetical protein
LHSPSGVLMGDSIVDGAAGGKRTILRCRPGEARDLRDDDSMDGQLP